MCIHIYTCVNIHMYVCIYHVHKNTYRAGGRGPGEIHIGRGAGTRRDDWASKRRSVRGASCARNMCVLAAASPLVDASRT